MICGGARSVAERNLTHGTYMHSCLVDAYLPTNSAQTEALALIDTNLQVHRLPIRICWRGRSAGGQEARQWRCAIADRLTPTFGGVRDGARGCDEQSIPSMSLAERRRTQSSIVPRDVETYDGPTIRTSAASLRTSSPMDD